jgi:hypothetical protein
MNETYRGYRITFDPPPIPDRRFDWHFAHEQFDGAPDSGDNRSGHAASLADCIREIDLMSETDLAERIARAIAANQGDPYAEYKSEFDSYGRVAAAVITAWGLSKDEREQ